MKAALRAAALAVLVLTLEPAPALAGSGPVTPPAPSCTPSMVTSVGSSFNRVTPIHGAGDVQCPMPSGLPGEPEGPRGPLPQRVFNVGADCTAVQYQPIRVVLDSAGNAHVQAAGPNGGSFGDVTWPGTGERGWMAGVPVSTAAHNAMYTPFKRPGTISATGACVPTPGSQWGIGCPDPQPWTDIMVSSNICWFTVPNAATSNGMPPGTIVPQLLTLRSQVDGLIDAGTMSSAPAAAGLVNTRTCFFVSNMSTPQNAQFQIVIPTPPDGLGRRIFFVFVITVTNAGMTWDFGDGSGDTTGLALPAQCTAQAAGAQVSAAHIYTRYSDGQPGGAYQVRAVEHYTIDVTEEWVDADGPHRVPVDMGALGVQPTIDKPVPAGGASFPQRVIQEEGVPVGV